MANNRTNAANINKVISLQVDQEFIEPTVNNFITDVTANSPVDTGRLQASWRKEKINENEYRIRNHSTVHTLCNKWYSKSLTEQFC